MKNMTSLQQSFAADLAKLPEWDGPKSLADFSESDWPRFAEYVRRDDGTLSEADQELCDEIADAIEADEA